MRGTGAGGFVEHSTVGSKPRSTDRHMSAGAIFAKVGVELNRCKASATLERTSSFISSDTRRCKCGKCGKNSKRGEYRKHGEEGKCK